MGDPVAGAVRTRAAYRPGRRHAGRAAPRRKGQGQPATQTMPGSPPVPLARRRSCRPDSYKFRQSGSRLCCGCCLRSERRATAMVTAAASTARPMIWPPTRRVSSGNDADTSATRMGTCVGDGDADGDGETSGKARVASSTGLGSTGSPERESTPGGRFPIGSNTPTPAGEVVPAGVVEGAGFALTRTLSEEDAEAAACGEVRSP